MPFTPYHAGPGILFKGLLNKRFSLVMFLAAQFFIDLEALYYILKDSEPYHRFFHSFIGTIVLSVFLFFIVYKFINMRIRKEDNDKIKPISKTAALSGIILGVYSHFILDAFLYPEMKAYHIIKNIFPHQIVTYQIESLCIITGLSGVFLLSAYKFISGKSKK